MVPEDHHDQSHEFPAHKPCFPIAVQPVSQFEYMAPGPLQSESKVRIPQSGSDNKLRHFRTQPVRTETKEAPNQCWTGTAPQPRQHRGKGSGWARQPYLQHLRVIKDLVLVAALAIGRDPIRQVCTLVQHQHRLPVLSLESLQLRPVLRVQSHLRRQDEVPARTEKPQPGDPRASRVCFRAALEHIHFRPGGAERD